MKRLFLFVTIWIFIGFNFVLSKFVDRGEWYNQFVPKPDTIITVSPFNLDNYYQIGATHLTTNSKYRYRTQLYCFGLRVWDGTIVMESDILYDGIESLPDNNNKKAIYGKYYDCNYIETHITDITPIFAEQNAINKILIEFSKFCKNLFLVICRMNSLNSIISKKIQLMKIQTMLHECIK